MLLLLSPYFRNWKMFSTEKNTILQTGLLTFQHLMSTNKIQVRDTIHCHKEKQTSQGQNGNMHGLPSDLWDETVLCSREGRGSSVNEGIRRTLWGPQIFTSYLTTCPTSASGWHVVLSRNSKTTELLEEDLGEPLQELRTATYLTQTLKAIFHETKSWENEPH